MNIFKHILENLRKKSQFLEFANERHKIKNWFYLYIIHSSFILMIYDLLVLKILKQRSELNFPIVYKNGVLIYKGLGDFMRHQSVLEYYTSAYNSYMGDFYKYYGYSIVFSKDDTIIDVGAHIGTFCIPLAVEEKSSNIKILAYEADSINYNLISKSVNRLQDVLNIRIFHNAVCDKSDNLLRFSSGLRSTIGSIDKVNFFLNDKKSKYYDVQTISLKRIFDTNNIDKCKLLKIDCEGCEYLLFNDEAFSLLEKVEYLFIEIHKVENMNMKKLMNKLEDKGFEFKTNFLCDSAWELFGVNKHIKI